MSYRKANIYLLTFFLLFTTALHAKSSEAKTWSKAKKNARKEFSSFHEAISSIKKNKKDRKKLLKECGLTTSTKLSKYVNFDLDFGKTLNTLHDLKKQYKKAVKKDTLYLVSSPKAIPLILANKKLLTEFKVFLKKEVSLENLQFHQDVINEKSGQYLYETYVVTNAPRQINIDKHKAEWEDIANSQNPQWQGKNYEKLLKNTNKQAVDNMLDTCGRFILQYSKAATRKNIDKQIKETKKKLLKTIEEYQKRVKNLQKDTKDGFELLEDNKIDTKELDFAESLLSALKKIKKKINKN